MCLCLFFSFSLYYYFLHYVCLRFRHHVSRVRLCTQARLLVQLVLSQEVAKLTVSLAAKFWNTVSHFTDSKKEERSKSEGERRKRAIWVPASVCGPRGRAVDDLTVWGGGSQWAVSTTFQDALVYFCLWDDGKFDCGRNKLTPRCSLPARPDQPRRGE